MKHAALFISLFFVVSCKVESWIDDNFLGGVQFSSSSSEVVISQDSVPVGQTAVVTLQSRDGSGKPFRVTNAASVISFSLRGGTSNGSFSSIVDNGDGSYVSTFTATSSGTPAEIIATVNTDVIAGNASVTVVVAAPGSFNMSTLAGSSNAIISWTASDRAASYKVKYGVAPGVYSTTVSSNAESPVVVTGLNPGSNYNFVVEAVNSTGITTSAEVIATPLNHIKGGIVGVVGKLSASSGTCPSSGPSGKWCTGGTFTSGSGDGELSGLSSLQVDSVNGFFYTVEIGNNRVSKFNLKTGTYVGSVGLLASSVGTCPSSGVSTGWCTGGTFTSGSGDGMFSNPRGITIDTVNGFFYVGEQSNFRVQKFNLATGAYVGAIGVVSSSTGSCPSSGFTGGWCTGGVFVSSAVDGGMGVVYAGLAADPVSNSLIVADITRSRVQKFNLNSGAYIGSIGRLSSPSTGSCPTSGVASGWCTGGTFLSGTIDGSYPSVYSLAVDSTHGHILIATQGTSSRIQKVEIGSGAYVGSLGKTSATGTGTCPASGTASGWCTTGTFVSGSEDGAFNSPRGVGVDPDNNTFYVSDYDNHRVQKYVLDTGAFVGAIGVTSASTGTCPVGKASEWCTGGTFISSGADGGFGGPTGVAVDFVRKFLFVSDQGVNKVNWIH